MEDFAKSRFPPVVKTDWEPDQLKLELELLADMVAKADKAADAFAAMAAGLDPRRAKKARDAANLARYMGCVWRTAANLKRGVLATLEGRTGDIPAIARDEYRNKLNALRLVDADSRLGWEPSMDYMGGRPVIEWALKLMDETYGFSRTDFERK